MNMLENGMVREILGPKTEEVTEYLKQLYDDWLHDLDCSLGIIPVI
jgi:hypothetical protein